MLLSNPDELKEQVKKPARLMGLDLGTKTIGLALSDTVWMVASPLEIIRRKKFGPDSEKLIALIETHDVGGLVMGLPLNMDGSEGPRSQATRAFVRNFLAKKDIPVLFWDERLSTAAVQRMMVDELDMTRKRRGEVVDKLAAAYILQGCLDSLRN